MCTDYKIDIGDDYGYGYSIRVLNTHYISDIEIDYKDLETHMIRNILYIDDLLNSKQLKLYISRYLC
jgi:phosphoribosyl 1,2-cyclic phosphodiesterase